MKMRKSDSHSSKPPGTTRVSSTMSTSELSQDLMEDILCRVPALSLKRLRSTCKEWSSLFNDEGFRRKHFDKALKQSMVLMFTMNYRICSLNVNLNEKPSVEVGVELGKISISKVFHCDGLLLYINKAKTIHRMVVWNPFMGNTRWIQQIDLNRRYHSYVLGSYQDNKSGNTSYKVLRYRFARGHKPKIEICELYSNSWRILDVTPDFWLGGDSCVSLKGKTYWVGGFYGNECKYNMVSFDYTTEIFKSRIPLPYQFPTGSCNYRTIVISSVREEKLSVLLQHRDTSRKEIWVTNKIDETSQVLSWSKVLSLDYPDFGLCFRPSFLFDEENRKIVCSERSLSDDGHNRHYQVDWVYIVGENNEVTQLGFEKDYSFNGVRPHLFKYVPSLVQSSTLGAKYKRGDYRTK